MTSLAKFLRSARVHEAHERHKHDPMMTAYLSEWHTPVESTLPDADAREQIDRLNRVGVGCLSVEKTKAGVRVVFAVPAGVRVG